MSQHSQSDILRCPYIAFQVIGYQVPFFQVSPVLGEHIVSVLPLIPQSVVSAFLD